jgi:hypothetical protein
MMRDEMVGTYQRPRLARFCVGSMLPPGTIHPLLTSLPWIVTRARYDAVAIDVGTEWCNALACARGLVEHAIDAIDRFTEIIICFHCKRSGGGGDDDVDG